LRCERLQRSEANRSWLLQHRLADFEEDMPPSILDDNAFDPGGFRFPKSPNFTLTRAILRFRSFYSCAQFRTLLQNARGIWIVVPIGGASQHCTQEGS